MAAILFNSLHPHLCSNPCFLQFHPNTSLFSYTNISSSLSPNPPKNPKPNHPPNPLPLPSTANNSNVSVSIGSISPSADAVIKVPTAPWMKGPLLLQSDEVIDLSKSNAKKSFRKGKLGNSDDKELIEKESGVRGKKAMNKIVESIEKLQKTKNSNVPQKKSTEFQFGDYMERNEEKEDLRTRGKMPWEKDDRIVFRRTKKEKDDIGCGIDS
ncbi:chloroplastic group IIA intron splicing facilitator CRS1, chloroplastic [Quillaja saponaria]|uniref:Chloroplastic group IIA intron splicing facilitator CRS1, chloroplastic n=1 Tax=Quillaja saponaria TaxID=32244 RepID=A0AAD7PXY2_QUISA|nr:chloroplastic group IIA intron splicing facilitator CRS1, chloroplastic [Quillaja saponaria]